MKPRIFLLLLLLNLPTTLSVEEELVGKDEEKVVGKDEEKVVGKDKEKQEEEEDTCLTSPCGSRARCKNVKVRTLSLQKVQDQAESLGLHSVLPDHTPLDVVIKLLLCPLLLPACSCDPVSLFSWSG